MTITLAQTPRSASNGLSAVAVTIDSDPTPGNVLAYYHSARDARPSAPAGWTMHPFGPAKVSAANDYGCWFYKIAEASDTTTIQTALSASNANRATVFELVGVTITDLIGPDQGFGSSTHIVAASVTPTAGRECIVLGGITVRVEDFNSPSVAPDSGYTEADDAKVDTGLHPHHFVCYQIVSSSSGSYQPGGTISGASTTLFGSLTLVLYGSADPPEGDPDPSPDAEPGFWIDFDLDGFSSTGGSGDTDAPLARMLPEGSTGGTATFSDNVTSEVESIRIDRKAATDGGSIAGSLTARLRNRAGKYNPENTSSPVYGKVKPGLPVWFGVNADGTMNDKGATVYGRFGGYLKTIAPIPAPGMGDAPDTELVVTDAMDRYQGAKARVIFGVDRSVQTFRQLILTSIHETHLDLDSEPDTLTFSGTSGINMRQGVRTTDGRIISRITSALAAALPKNRGNRLPALSLLEDLNRSYGTRHWITPADSKEDFYNYTTANRQHKLSSAADAAFTSGITEMNGYIVSDEGIVNSVSAEGRAVRVPLATSIIWTYPTLPMPMDASGSRIILADFGDFVYDASLTVNSAGGLVAGAMVAYGDGAAIQLTASGNDTVTDLHIEGRLVERLESQVIEQTDSSSVGAYGERSMTISSDYLQNTGVAEGIAAYELWANAQPRKTPSISTVNHLSTVLPLDLYDVVTLTVAQLDVSARRFEVVGISETWERSTDAGLVIASFTLDLRETPVQSALSFFTFGSSLLGGSDGLAP